eukprot:1086287-Pelagomonas_calceolata.AAC.3
MLPSVKCYQASTSALLSFACWLPAACMPGCRALSVVLIGATTLNEYRQHMEKDAALERRFQQVMVGEPSVPDTINILRGIKEKYETHHGLVCSSEDAKPFVNVCASVTGPVVAAPLPAQAPILLSFVRFLARAVCASVTAPSSWLLSCQTATSPPATCRTRPSTSCALERGIRPWMDEACSNVRVELDSKPEVIDGMERMRTRLQVEQAALKKEKDQISIGRLEQVEEELAALEEQPSGAVKKELAALEEHLAPLVVQYNSERARLDEIRGLQAKREQVRGQKEQPWNEAWMGGRQEGLPAEPGVLLTLYALIVDLHITGEALASDACLRRGGVPQLQSWRVCCLLMTKLKPSALTSCVPVSVSADAGEHRPGRATR